MFLNTDYSTDVFLGTTLNIFDFHINGYPVSFFVWNIAFAVLAILLTFWTARIWRSKKSWLIKLGAFLLWLAIFPNAAYLMTDARHIIDYCPSGSYGRVCLPNAWMTLFFCAYGALGWPALVFSLRPLKEVFSKYYGQIKGMIFAISMCFLGALGLLMGLLNRLNSWQIITRPWEVIKTAAFYFYDPVGIKNLLMSFIILTILYFLGEKIFVNPKIK